MSNFMELRFSSRSENESFARIAVAAFVSQLDPTLEELTEIKTVVSEAVTNAIIHGYENSPDGEVIIHTTLEDQTVYLVIEDKGVGIANLEEAKQPLFTTKPELERSGMGFTIMENFMDKVEIMTEVGIGTKVSMVKHLTNSHVVSK
ncbi:anti-sigma F factor [Microaerobacter geothermalis]|uniref:anti-sigma F factor n=1 Tax=Microaerobacter geothermalis TaxID=674972 RepID=UPI001F1C64CE|nr:anti-sigma F factor [Microaerobacter geothermalis]MCF6093473.1 anti-sigma F factor [Microaerobacter geothermalis]